MPDIKSLDSATYISIEQNAVDHNIDEQSVVEQDLAERTQHWQPGIVAHIPWLGLCALLGACACLVAAISVLVVANKAPTAGWSVRPSVYLSIAATIGNILLRLALREGVSVAWWRQAMETSSIAELHSTWASGSSVWQATKAAKNLDFVALACLAISLAPINGPLLQRASQTAFQDVENTTNMTLSILPQLPTGYTGIIDYRQAINWLSSNFTTVVQNFTLQEPITIHAGGCKGLCRSKIRTAGWAVNCTTYTNSTPFDINPTFYSNGSINFATEAFEGLEEFAVSILWTTDTAGVIDLNVTYKDTNECSGWLTNRMCHLQAATVESDVIFNGNLSTISLDPAATIFDDLVVNITTIEEADADDDEGSTLGGMAVALQNLYSSSSVVNWGGARSWEFNNSGALTNRYGYQGGCGATFSDPTDEILAAAREMMFRSAIQATGGAPGTPPSSPETFTANQVSTELIYVSDYVYLAIASVFTFLGCLLVVPTYSSFWKLGRRMGLSPMETAKAFRAPILQDAGSNDEIERLLKAVGNRTIKYGAVLAEDGKSLVLRFGDPTAVTQPLRGESFAQ